MEFFAEYGLFFAKAITVVIAIIVVVGAVAAQAAKGKIPGMEDGQIEITHINEQLDGFEQQLQEALLSDEAFKKQQQDKKKASKEDKKLEKKGQGKQRNKVFVIDFDGDVKASEVENLRKEITATLTVAGKDDEIVVNVESPGGMVHTYGLAASQLQRIRSADIPLTICVDKVAASGGYLMACVGNKIVAAPFALIGSIGVLAQIPNFSRILKKYDVDYEVMTAGEYKAPITMFGEITDKGKNKLKEELEETHVLFKNFINDHRPQVDVDKVSTGEVWYGQRAIDNQLVDSISTSDDYLMAMWKTHDIYQVKYVEKKTFQEKLGLNVQHGIKSAVESLVQKSVETSITKDIT